MSIETYVDKPWGDRFPAFATIDYADSSGGYEWDQFHVIRGCDGYLYTGEGVGCSCYGFWDSADAPKRAKNWIEVADRIKAWIAEGYDYSNRESTGMRLIERLAASKPDGHIDTADPKWPVMR